MSRARVLFRVMAGYYAAQGVALQVFDDLIDCWMMLIVFMVISCVVTFVLILLMRWFAGIIIWTLLIAVHIALIAGESARIRPVYFGSTCLFLN